jgi:alpha-tubulin suppressor-like RCC1 family protein
MVGAVWNRVVVIGGLALALSSVGCGSGTVVDDDDLLPEQCTSSAMCDDGNFCNGEETCDPASSFASTRGCVPGLPPCGADTFCDNDAGVCTVLCGDGDGDGHDGVPCGGDDCDDTNPGRFPGNLEVCDAFDVDEDCNPLTFGTLDEDDDGHVDLACCNEDTAGMRYCGDDCADQRRDTRPGMPEVCDGIDNDCDTMLDEGVTVTGRPDMDFDLHGDEGAAPVMRCADTQGFSVLSDDCDDGRVTAHSAQLEICDGQDNDCDDLVDENAVAVAWYPDDDVDGFGDADATPVISCAVVSGHAVRTGDCDDSDQSLSPSAAERCDGRDNNCDGVANFLINFGDTEDDDEDGFPDMRCGGNDCNDGNPSVYPGAMELCDGVDNDCDGVVDADSADALWYLDLDGDGFGDATGGTMLSCTPIANRIARGGDCNDGDAAIRPAANDACNGIDDDCDGTTDESGLRFPFYPDQDDDGVGDTSGGVIFACPGREPAGVSQAQGDCDDDDDTIYAGAPELCDGDDNDCDGVTDEDAPQAWFPDGDSDGRGVAAGGMTTCNPPVGYVLFSDDCNDLDANNFPTNEESCDGLDNDCDSQADNGADAACMLSTGTGVCSMGACQVADCAAGRDDCDTTFATGCEVDTNRNPSHCGACLSPCNLGDSCGTTGALGTCDQAPFAQLAASWDQMYMLRSTGGTVVWGANTAGELGDGGGISRTVPVEGSRGWVEIDAGEGFGCVRNAAGRVFCFGSTANGKLGNGISDGTVRATPVPVVGLTDAITVSAGYDHACAIRQGGQVVCWGNNPRGQLGTGAIGGTFATPTPSLVTDAIDIYAGFEFTCALRPNPSGGNRVTCWGENDEGELGRGFTSTSEISTEVDVIGLPSDVIQLGQSAAGAFTCARSSGGGVYCWGFSSFNAVGQATNALVAVRISDANGPIADAVKVVPGVDGVCALRPGDGPGRFAVWCWGGRNALGQSPLPPHSSLALQVRDTTMTPITDALDVAVGQEWACATRSDGGVWCWGLDTNGVQGNGAVTGVQLLAHRVMTLFPADP